MAATNTADNQPVAELSTVRQLVRQITDEVARVLVGQRHVVDRLLIGLLCGGHVLLEGVPGLGKTLAVRCLASAIGGKFQRIQFTPDLLPADLIGTQIFNPRTAEFYVRLGPIFANIVLADEINRAPPKVQSALLEAMQERQVTIGPETHRLPEPFFVMATQNPIEQEGTYPLPEAELDRFMLKVLVDYPEPEEEQVILDRMGRTAPDLTVQAVTTVEEVLAAQRAIDQVYLDERVKRYVLDVVRATRSPDLYGIPVQPLVRYGASPRATIYLALAARVHAVLNDREYVTPYDVKQIAPDVLRHRVLLTYEAEAEDVTSDDVIAQILDHVPVP